MDDDSDDEFWMFRFVEAGMRLTYEFDPIGELQAGVGHTIEFIPLVCVRGWSNHKELVASLRFVHRSGDRREIGRGLLDQDEVDAWERLLRPMQGNCSSTGPFPLRRLDYSSRHGIRLVWQSAEKSLEPAWQLFVAVPQAAILPRDFLDQFLAIFERFAELRKRYE